MQEDVVLSVFEMVCVSGFMYWLSGEGLWIPAILLAVGLRDIPVTL